MHSLACAFGILGLGVPEQKKGNLKLLLKYILRLFNSKDVEVIDDGGSFSTQNYMITLSEYIKKKKFKTIGKK